MKREDTVDHHIKSTWHAVYRMYNQQAVKNDFTTTIGFVLLNISSKEGTPATKIAPMMGLESRSLTRMLKSMEEKNLIYRSKDPNDGRSVRIFLTELGIEKKEISRLTVLNFNEDVREKIDPIKLQTFFEVIGQINKVIDKKQL